MLVTRRHEGESLLIGDEIEVRILEITPRWVKLGVVAPRDVPVVRQELRITKEQNRSAAQGFTEEQIGGLVRTLGYKISTRKVGGASDM